MFISRKVKKLTVISLVLGLLLSLVPFAFVQQANAATPDLQVQFGAGTTIGNLSYNADNSFLNFYNNQTPGFKQTLTSPNARMDWAAGDVFAGLNDKSATVHFQIRIADNPTLRDLALSGHAEMLVGWSVLRYHSGFLWDRKSSVYFKIDGQEILSGWASSGNVYNKSASAIIKPNSVIDIEVYGEGDDDGEAAGIRGMYIKFQDKQRPVLSSYTFTGNGAERENTTLNQMELYVKKDENVTLSYNFTEPVRPTALNSAYYDHFLRHPLFVNPAGTGLPAAGEQQYLKNISYTPATLGSYQSKITYQYTGSIYHQSGNLPLEPKITGTTTGTSPMDKTLEEKFKEAVLADAAGNVATVSFPNVADASSNAAVKDKQVNPFDYKNGGYRVIVDAVRPKYTKVGNGIQPEILTGVTLNLGDVIDFTVQMTEEAVVRKGWDVNKTFLYFNNGMKAYYTGGSNTKNWTFRVTITDEVDLETPLLKVIALSNDAKGNESDIDVIQDYAGNLLIQPANYSGTHEDGDISLVNSKIDWANLSIDNTKPLIGYRYEAGGASDLSYQKYGRVTIDANDPAILIPALDPVIADRGKERPSKGIYRPSNMTGDAAPSVGLVYYMWSRDKSDPFESKSGDNFAAIKRYSLTAKQPSEDLYEGEFKDVQLQVANNKTNLLSPPPEANNPENSGEWYLHTWTADMTWDSSRELEQYDKMKDYVRKNSEQYEAWKAEAPGSEADKIFYADNKALAAVGNYGDIETWELDYFKRNDSNWTHNVGILKLDNQIPTITNAGITGDRSDNVTINALVQDEHSGVSQVFYQWVKDGSQLANIDWKPGNYTGTTLTQSSADDVFEDGAYWLYIKAVDNAGNETVQTPLETPVVVDSQKSVPAQFTPESNPDYVQSHEVTFQISGAAPDFVGYAITSSVNHPVNEAGFTALQPIASLAEDNKTDTLLPTASPLPDPMLSPTLSPTLSPSPSSSPDASPGGDKDKSVSDAVPSGDKPETAAAPLTTTSYIIPADSSRSGIQYIHMIVKNGDRAYYYSKAYYFDNEAPSVTFSKSGVPYPLAKQDVKVSVAEFYSKKGLVSKYQWVKEGSPQPDQASEGWIALPDGGLVFIDGTALKAGEVADYRLYVWVTDGAGNSTTTATQDIFKVSASPDKDTPPAKADSALIYLSGDETDGYTAIVKLSLETENKAGYEYSISPDNGESWVKWRPYTNFVSVKVPTGVPDQLRIQVKFRTPGGKVGDPMKLDIKGSSLEETPVYALASITNTNLVTSAVGVDIEIALPTGIKVVPSKVNPGELVRSGNKFHVKESGFYSFDLSDLSNANRTDTLYIVVKNVDDTLPEATVEYSYTGETNQDVIAYLRNPSKPITITNNNGKDSYTFKENGTFTFEFKDAAGNVNKKTATVEKINKEAPRVKLVRSYQYGPNGSLTFDTLLDSKGNVIASSGVVLQPEKADPSAKDFKVRSQNEKTTLTENGAVSFIVEDEYGNTSVIKEEVTNIISQPPQVDSVAYTFVDENDKAIEAGKIFTIDGQKYAKGKIKATITGHTTGPNMVFSGMRPIESEGSYTNKISGADGKFTYSRVFESNGSALVAISDALGNANKVPVTIAGLDNTAPELKLKQETVGIVQNKPGFNAAADLGGYTVTDNLWKPENINVSVSGLDLKKLGRQRVTYTAVDQVGNTAVSYQDVVVVKDGGLLIFGNDTLISASSGESALFNQNTITFKVSGYNNMTVDGQDRINEWGTFDIYYQPGLYREGQMKAIAQKVTYQQLVSDQYKVTFPQVGWYTIIVRTQERDREYATFFVGSVK